jgi:hypothetical protein
MTQPIQTAANDANSLARVEAKAEANIEAQAAPNPHTVELDTPLVRGAQTITAVTLRKPTAGELRGTSLHDLARFDVSALQKVLPRISTPTLTEFEIGQLDPADLMALAGAF